MSAYSNIVILGTALLFAGDLLPIHDRTTRSLSSLVLPGVLLAKRGSTLAASGSFISQQQTSGLNDSKTSGTIAQASLPISDPPFLRHPIPFAANSLELDIAARNTLKRAAACLQRHREARILIVGSCDSGGSETCTHMLAEARGAAVQKFLRTAGIASDQIVGVKGWDSLDRSCRASEVECQRVNRSARIFMASSVAP